MWKIIIERGRPQMIIWRMRISYWIPKATNTPRMCYTHCFYTATMVARTYLSVTLYAHCLSYYFFAVDCTWIVCEKILLGRAEFG